MKSIILAIAVAVLPQYVLANGWSSSGGGEYIVNQNNPWFMGPKAVKWCIDHGGSDKFSLSFDLSKAEVTRGLDVLTKQLKSINKNIAEVKYPEQYGGRVIKTCPSLKCEGWKTIDGKTMSDTFTYTEDCADADLEIILGNYENEKIKTLISSMGEEKFKQLAGFAMRTEYSEKDLRGKGFIYIAADKGDIQYSGARSVRFTSDTIWNNYEKLNAKATFPGSISFSDEQTSNIFKNLSFKNYTMGLLEPVIAHEFGHVLGLGHNHYKNIMDEDYPANIIMNGLALKGNYLRESMLFSRGLIESKVSRRIGFEWNTNKMDKYDQMDLANTSPLINQFLFDIPQEYKDANTTSRFFIFDFTSQNSVSMATYELNSPKYKILKTFSFDEITPCSNPYQVEAINIRTSVPLRQTPGLAFNQSTGQWAQSGVRPGEMPSTVRLLSLYNNSICGKIYLNNANNNEFIKFKISHSYFSTPSEIELTENSSNNSITLSLQESHILGAVESSLPEPMPSLRFK